MVVSGRLEQAEESYARLFERYAKTSFASADADRRLAELARDEQISELKTKSQRLFFARRSLSDTGVTYRVFRTEMSAMVDEEPIGFCDIGKLGNGICVITNAEVDGSYQRKGIATAVYDLVTSDMARVGGLLWPVSPKNMSDPEFKVWWRRSPALVFYYPHRYRLGLEPRSEFEELYDEILNRGFWDKARAYWSAFLSKFRRSGSGGFGA